MAHPKEAGNRIAARLYVPDTLASGVAHALSADQAHYLVHVLRLGAGARIAAFNENDGEFAATIEAAGKHAWRLRITEFRRAPEPLPDLWLIAAPIKRDRIDLTVEKATELGISRFTAVLTRRTVPARVNLDRLRAHAREAAEQCERLSVPEITPPVALSAMLASLPSNRLLIVCDESGRSPPLTDVLRLLAKDAGPLAVLVGPEGGFAPEELDEISQHPCAKFVSLGPRVLRAETAAIAALAVVQALSGDWRQPRELAHSVTDPGT